MKGIYCDNKSLSSQGYCSYYGETFRSLKSVLNIEYKQLSPSKISQIGECDYIILGYGLTNCGYDAPKSILNDTNIPVFPIINKEYASLEEKLNWVKNMRATSAFSVHHDIDKFTSQTSIPFHRIMWSANEKQFRDYGGDYKHDLFFSGVTRPEQSENLRERVLLELNRLNGELGNFINARSHRNNYAGAIFTDDEYSKHLSDSKLCLVTTGPADLVGTRFFEIFAGNRSLVICNRMDEKIYGDMIIDGVNCVMFSTVDEFYEKAQYYLDNENERICIVNNAYKIFNERLTWSYRAKEIKKIILDQL
jgi:spore maturation protein CgeB